MFLDDILDQSINTRNGIIDILPRPSIHLVLKQEDIQEAVNQGSDQRHEAYQSDMEEIHASLEGRSGTATLEHFGLEEPETMTERFGEEKYPDGSYFLREKLDHFKIRGSYGITKDGEDSYFLYGTDTENYDKKYLALVPVRFPHHLFMEIETDRDSGARINAKYLPVNEIPLE